MKNLEIEVLIFDKCTKKEAKHYLEKGTTVFNPDDYFEMLKDYGLLESMNIKNKSDIIDMCKKSYKCEDTSFLMYNDIPYIIEYFV